MATAGMRVLGRDADGVRLLGRDKDLVPLQFVEDDECHGSTNPYMIQVPAFGVLVIARVPVHEPIVRIVPPKWIALLIQPDPNGEFSEQSAKHARHAVEAGNHVDVELLPGHGGQRLVVVLEPDELAPVRACRVCGCTDDYACLPPCTWVEYDLCSACA